MTDEDVWQACRYVNADGFIQKLEGGEVSDEVLQEYADPESEKYEQMVKDICKMQNFTSLRYHRLDDLLESIGIDPDNICTYCFNGKE